MDQVEIPFSLRCPDHRAQVIGMLNPDPNAQKIGYCYGCLAQNGKDGSLFETLKTVSAYLEDSSSFYEKCRQRARNAGEPPAGYIEELSKKGERLEKLSKHIDQEKEKVKRNFEDIRKTVIQIINEKEKECIELLEKEVLDLSGAYTLYEKLMIMGWPKPSDIRNIYPETDILVQKMSQIGSVDQLRDFMTGIQEDIRTQDEYFGEDDDLSKIKRRIKGLIRGLNILEDSFPKIQSQILNSENLENFIKDLMERLTQQEIQVENSIAQRMKKAPTPESKIIVDDQFETLRNWLPKGYKFDLKLLFRGSVDGMSAEKFHEKCDKQGATITLIKCKFDGAVSSKIIGGFLDQSMHSKKKWSISKEAFLFSLAEDGGNSVKCLILENYFANAYYGNPQYGPIFGRDSGGHDLYLERDLKTGEITPKSYSNSVALRDGNESVFNVEEVEVFQVL